MDDLNKEQDSAFENRNKLYAERDELKKKIDEQWTMKKEARSTYKSANDAYCSFSVPVFGLVGSWTGLGEQIPR